MRVEVMLLSIGLAHALGTPLIGWWAGHNSPQLQAILGPPYVSSLVVFTGVLLLCAGQGVRCWMLRGEPRSPARAAAFLILVADLIGGPASYGFFHELSVESKLGSVDWEKIRMEAGGMIRKRGEAAADPGQYHLGALHRGDPDFAALSEGMRGLHPHDVQFYQDSLALQLEHALGHDEELRVYPREPESPPAAPSDGGKVSKVAEGVYYVTCDY